MLIITKRDTAVLLYSLSFIITQICFIQIFFFQTKICIPKVLGREQWLHTMAICPNFSAVSSFLVWVCSSRVASPHLQGGPWTFWGKGLHGSSEGATSCLLLRQGQKANSGFVPGRILPVERVFPWLLLTPDVHGSWEPAQRQHLSFRRAPT